MFDLTGRVALVTGGGRGLGRAMAAGLATAGATVVLSSRTEHELDEAAAAMSDAGGDVLAIPWDLAEPQAPAALVDEVVTRRGQLDVLVHAAGHHRRRPALELTPEEWDGIQQVHLRAAFELSQAAGGHLLAREAAGRIIFVASMTSRIGIKDLAAYGAAKSGLLGLMRTLAVEWAPHGVTVNAIAPGFFHTRLTADVYSDAERRAWFLSRIPAGRPGEPEELAGAAVFFASPASSYVTGHVMHVDGGWLAS